jgi:hypothetical protein
VIFVSGETNERSIKINPTNWMNLSTISVKQLHYRVQGTIQEACSFLRAEGDILNTYCNGEFF